MSEARPTFPRLPRNLMLAISFGQGIALFLLWRALSEGVWPSLTPVINFPLWTLVVVGPTLLLLTVETGNLLRSLKAVGLFTGILVLLAVYIGWQASPHAAFPIEWLLFVYVATSLIACFKGLMYLQQWVTRSPRSYAALFALSWRNFLVAALAGALAVGVNLILFLAAELFAAIGIGFFRELVLKDWFLIPVLTVAFGLGVQIFRNRVRVIDGITVLLEGLTRMLLPLVAAVVAIFLVALPFTGLVPLWETGNGTALLLWLNAFALFLVNAAYQTGRDLPYPAPVHGVLSAAIALVPIVSVLALYGLVLRIDEYGLTVARLWAMTVFLVLALFSGGYASLVILKRLAWPQHLGSVNIAMGWVLLILMLLVNSPLLDYRSISLGSQLARVEAGEIEFRDFDFHYARQQLARPGYLEMQSLLARFEDSDPELALRIRDHIRRPILRNRGKDRDPDQMWEQIVHRPEPFEAPAGLREAILRSISKSPWEHDTSILIRVDLDTDGTPEYVMLSKEQDDPYPDYDSIGVWRYIRDEDGWKGRRLYNVSVDRREHPDVENMLREGEITLVHPRYQNLKVGDLQFRQGS